MVSIKTAYVAEKKKVAEVLLWEEPHAYSRDRVTIASGAGVVEVGHVIGKITASGKYTPTDPGAVDGSEVAVAVAIEEVDATAADRQALAVVRDAIVGEQALVWHPSLDTANERATAKGQLANAGILAREGA